MTSRSNLTRLYVTRTFVIIGVLLGVRRGHGLRELAVDHLRSERFLVESSQQRVVGVAVVVADHFAEVVEHVCVGWAQHRKRSAVGRKATSDGCRGLAVGGCKRWRSEVDSESERECLAQFC